MMMTALRATAGRAWPVMPAIWMDNASSRPRLPGGLVSVAWRARAWASASRSIGGMAGSASVMAALSLDIPQRLGHAALAVLEARHHKQQIGKAIEIAQRETAHRLFARQR